MKAFQMFRMSWNTGRAGPPGSVSWLTRLVFCLQDGFEDGFQAQAGRDEAG